MNYDEYAARFGAHDGIARVRELARLAEGGREYPLLEVDSPGARTLLITAGFHGDETAGPLTLLDRLPEIVAHAATRGVGLLIYPCLNPSGFEDGTRYNRSGEAPNNDFLRYELAPGRWVDELPPGADTAPWSVYRQGPKETRALLAALESRPAPAAALDLHQDPWLAGAFAYAYTFGPRAVYRPLLDATRAVVPLSRDTDVDEGVRTDSEGVIELHDGSVTDYCFRRGTPFAVALETTTRTPLAACHEVNLIWIHGLIDLVAQHP